MAYTPTPIQQQVLKQQKLAQMGGTVTPAPYTGAQTDPTESTKQLEAAKQSILDSRTAALSPQAPVTSAPMTAAPSSGAAPTSADPFASMGGGVYVNGGWLPQGHPGIPADMTPQTAQPGAAPAATPGAPAAPAAPGAAAPATPQTVNQAYMDALMGILQPAPINAQTLQTDPAVQAFRLQSQRGAERQQAQNAETAALNGMLHTGGFEALQAGAGQARSEADATFVGSLASERLAQQRNELLQGISFAQNQGQFAEAQRLQRELAALDRAMQEKQMAESGRQFDLGLGFNFTSLEQHANAEAARLLAGLT